MRGGWRMEDLLGESICREWVEREVREDCKRKRYGHGFSAPRLAGKFPGGPRHGGGLLSV